MSKLRRSWRRRSPARAARRLLSYVRSRHFQPRHRSCNRHLGGRSYGGHRRRCGSTGSTQADPPDDGLRIDHETGHEVQRYHPISRGCGRGYRQCIPRRDEPAADAVHAKGADNQEVYLTFSPHFQRILLESKKCLLEYVDQKPANNSESILPTSFLVLEQILAANDNVIRMMVSKLNSRSRVGTTVRTRKHGDARFCLV